MDKSRKLTKNVAVSAIVFVIALVSLFAGVLTGVKADTVYYQVPGWFYGAYNAQPVEVGGKYYQNYNHGYIERDGATTSANIIKVVGGKRINQTTGEEFWIPIDYNDHSYGVEKVGAWVFCNMDGVKIDIASAGKDTYENIRDSMIKKFRGLRDIGFNPGLSVRIIVAWDGVVCQMYAHGDSTAINDVKGEVYAQTSLGYDPNASMLIYNPTDKNTYIVVDQYYETYLKNRKDLGYALGDGAERYFTYSDGTKLYPYSQLFQKGYIYSEDGETFKVVKSHDYIAVENAFNGFDLPEERADQFGAYDPDEAFEKDGVHYINCELGFVSASLIAGKWRYTYNFGKQIDEDLKITFIGKTEYLNTLKTDVAAAVASTGVTYDMFKTAVGSAYDKGIMLGMSLAGVEAWKEGFAAQTFVFGDGTYIEGDTNRAYAIISEASAPNIYMISKFSEQWAPNRGKLGAPVTDYGTNTKTINGASKTVEKSQFFEGGYIYEDAGTIKTIICMTDSTGYWEVTVRNEFGEFVGEVTVGSDLYFNYERGYVKIVSKTPFVYDTIACKNINSSGQESFTVTAENIEEYVLIGKKDAILDVDSTIDLDDLLKAFQDKYLALVENGYNPGIWNRGIEVWDGVIYQPYGYGDGGFNNTYGLPGASILAYNTDTEEVYLIKGAYGNIWHQSPRTYGMPYSDSIADATIKLNGTNANYAQAQKFQNGFMFTKDGNSVGVSALYYKNTDSYYSGEKVPTNYGAPKGDAFSDTKYIYFNYEYGCVRVALDGSGSQKFGARSFSAEGVLSALQNKEHFMGLLDTIDVKSNFGKDKQALMLQAVKEKYEALWDAGYFPGWPQLEMSIWNGTFCVQFYVGDSTANPLSSRDARTNCTMLAVNLDAQGNVTSINVMKDEMVMLWVKLYNLPYRNVKDITPISEAVTDGIYTYQTFKKGNTEYTIIIMHKNIEAFAVTKLSFSEWKTANEAWGSTADHGKDSGKGYIGDTVASGKSDGCKNNAAIAVTVIPLLGIFIFGKRRFS